MGGGAKATGGGAPGKLVGGGAPGKVVGGGPGSVELLTTDVQALTAIARQLVGEVRSGNVDPARLASLQAQLSKLPSGILQAAGAAGTITSDGTTVGEPPAPGTSNGDVAADAATATGAGAGARTETVDRPTPGVDANAAAKSLPAGSSATVAAGSIPADLHGRQARFAQLPQELQDAVAAAFGSNRGSSAFKPDQLLAFSKDGSVRLVNAGTVYLRHREQVRGAGPGEDRAMTMRPNRQPGSTGQRMAGGAATTRPTVAGGGGTGGQHAGHVTGSGATGSASGSRASSVRLFAPGGETRHVDLGGINGTFTWSTLPAKARTAILDALRTGDDAASRAYASRGSGQWVFQPDATIVVAAGFASFPSGLVLLPAPDAPRPTPAVTGGGPTTQPVGHDARRPPTGGGATGGGSGTDRPNVAPPVPPIVGTSGSSTTGGHSHASGVGHSH
jgi:hypothetical protein